MHLGLPHNIDQPSYGFGTGQRSGQDILNAYLDQQVIPITVSDEAMRAAMGFVPVAGTIHNWDHMEPWERGLSMGLDAIDIATLGGGKAITAPIKAATRFATRGDPALTFLRMGNMPVTADGSRVAWEYPTYQSYFDKTLPPQGNFGPSLNYGTKEPEVGLSVYQGLQFPWDPSQATNLYMRPLDTHGALGQKQLWNQGAFTRPMYQVKGTPIKTLGSDLETLIDPATAQYVQKINPPNPHQYREGLNAATKTPAKPFEAGLPAITKQQYSDWNKAVKEFPEVAFENFMDIEQPYNRFVTNPITGEVINLEKEFYKYGRSGQRTNPLYRLDDVIAPWLQKPVINPNLPVSLPGRVPMQMYDNEANINQPPIVVMNRTGSIRDATYG